MHTLIVSATLAEIAPFLAQLDGSAQRLGPLHYRAGQAECEILVTGVGLLATAWRLTQWLERSPRRPDALLNLGIAGSFRRDWPLGSAWAIGSERLGDTGAQMADGRMAELFELGLADAGAFPFAEGALPADWLPSAAAQGTASSLSVALVAGTDALAAQRRAQFGADLENMEGAAVFFVGKQAGIPVGGLRAVSNYVERRQREQWQIGPAIAALCRSAAAWWDAQG